MYEKPAARRLFTSLALTLASCGWNMAAEAGDHTPQKAEWGHTQHKSEDNGGGWEKRRAKNRSSCLVATAGSKPQRTSEGTCPAQVRGESSSSLGASFPMKLPHALSCYRLLHWDFVHPSLQTVLEKLSHKKLTRRDGISQLRCGVFLLEKLDIQTWPSPAKKKQEPLSDHRSRPNKSTHSNMLPGTLTER